MNVLETPYLDQEVPELNGKLYEESFLSGEMSSPFLTDMTFDEEAIEDVFEEDYEVLEDAYTFEENEEEDEWTDDFEDDFVEFSEEDYEEDFESDYDQEEQERDEVFSDSYETPETNYEDGFGHEDEADFYEEIEENLYNLENESSYENFMLEENETPNGLKNDGLSSIATQSEKQWNASKNRPSEWIGKVYGLVVHTTGGSLPGKAIANNVYPSQRAINWYTRGRKKRSFHGGCHYVNGWQGLEGGDLFQIANEREKAHGVSTSKQRKSINNRRFEKDLPAELIKNWKRRWPEYSHSLDLMPKRKHRSGKEHPNNCCIHVESTPVYYYLNKKAIVSKAYPPMRPGLRFTKAQHDAIAYLACDIAIRNNWPLDEAWWKTSRLVGHEDITPITRKDRRGGWDPGGLRDKPYFDWDYVYSKIEAIKNSGYKLPGHNAVTSGRGILGNIIDKGKAIATTLFSKSQLFSVAIAAISQGESDENKITNLVFYAKYPSKQGQKLQANDPLAKEWVHIRNTIVRPLLQKVKSNFESAAYIDSPEINHFSPEVEMGIFDTIFDSKTLFKKWADSVKNTVQTIAANIKAMTFTGLRNIPGQHSNGFVVIMLQQSNGSYKKTPLALYSRVKDVETYEHPRGSGKFRERFTLLDYPYIGRKGTVSLYKKRESRFGKALYGKGAVVRYNEGTHTLTVDGLQGFKVTAGSMADPTSDKLPKLKKGTYKLLIPRYPATFGGNYTSLTPYARSWFQIEDAYVGTSIGRYLHPGKTSHSCITVGENNSSNPNNARGTDVDIKNWTTLYEFLIVSRINNKYVGELIIT